MNGKVDFGRGLEELMWLKWVFLGDSVVKNLPANAGNVGSAPDLGSSHMLWSD